MRICQTSILILFRVSIFSLCISLVHCCGEPALMVCLEPPCHWQGAAKVISPFIIVAVFDVSFRRCI